MFIYPAQDNWRFQNVAKGRRRSRQVVLPWHGQSESKVPFCLTRTRHAACGLLLAAGCCARDSARHRHHANQNRNAKQNFQFSRDTYNHSNLSRRLPAGGALLLRSCLPLLRHFNVTRNLPVCWTPVKENEGSMLFARVQWCA